MGRWSQYDEDDYRLPEGMKRVGYDADSGKYFFRDKDGHLWEGQDGARFGEMTQGMHALSKVPRSFLRNFMTIAVSDAAAATNSDGDDVENGPKRDDGYALISGGAVTDDAPYPRHSSSNPYRMLFPFFLIIVVVLLLVWRLLVFPGWTPVKYSKCPEGSSRVTVVAGDTCWRIAEAGGCGLEALRKVNADLHCERLMPGDRICVPLVVKGDV
ncbi:hypothetical protein BJV78DRAFT_1226617 [Lactifluus subvellereus]|nr:hypothetical protein BJV78DRAFT_1226617 [Lactifluus subvellereus]